MKGTLLYGSVPFWNTEYAGEHRDMSKKFDKRKKVVYDLICDDLYTDEIQGTGNASSRGKRRQR